MVPFEFTQTTHRICEIYIGVTDHPAANAAFKRFVVHTSQENIHKYIYVMLLCRIALLAHIIYFKAT